VAYPGILFGGGGSTNSVEDRGRENGDLGAVAPYSEVPLIFKLVKSVFLLGCYRCIFHGTGNSGQLCQNFGISGGGGV
jgi:hypothetical protein